jgi:hypothetical protein
MGQKPSALPLAAARLLLPMRLQLLQRRRLTLRTRELSFVERRPVHREPCLTRPRDEPPLPPLLLPLLLLLLPRRHQLLPRRSRPLL